MPTTASPDPWKPQLYDKYSAHHTPTQAQSIIDCLHQHLTPRSRLLDLGCGTGVTTVRFQDCCAHVVGVDKSPAMVAASRQRGCYDVRVADGHDLQEAGIRPEEFDAVYSHDAIHWMKKDPVKVVREIHRCLKPGGYLTAKFFAHHGMSAIYSTLIAVVGQYGQDGAALAPWYLPTADEYKAILEQNGFRVHAINVTPEIVPLNITVRMALDMFADSFVGSWADEATKNEVFDKVVQAVEPVICRGGVYYADYVNLSVVAERL
ncbi:hypothetical protein H4R33_000604 [Dimargaris cristalligena]|uniref:S-adenosyl-L-methionine-dependent methyltransferase n=1 Tax=Dimargaris cristalligena TaxID=215637 RepID=A0A4Q0A164_9FUNG|nr:hypothetical protein H4R33_000604 [Dimargaris cristalligena]RKP39846.1 S-adenosyl-L-methionine-dependent methyltransferase [Dimargaris cristalligena]|eukprot:RKP39846.1 S-adenosyl-L-methionine-dependent methyltransferase [Dimargaris cristalligena]